MNLSSEIQNCMVYLSVSNVQPFLLCASPLLKYTDSNNVNIAATQGTEILFNMDRITSENFSKRDFLFIFCHEIWHILLGHAIRKGNRNHELWNIACDYFINNYLIHEVNLIKSEDLVYSNCLQDSKYLGLSEEAIYEKLLKDNKPKEEYSFDILADDIKYSDSNDKKENQSNNPVISEKLKEQIANVITQAKQMVHAYGYGKDPMLDHFGDTAVAILKPAIKWERVLTPYLVDLVDNPDYSWAKRNKRYSEHYLPSLVCEESCIINFYVDISGSISRNQMDRFFSEIVRIRNIIEPEVLDVITFDTEIVNRFEIKSTKNIADIKLNSGGGTDLKSVFEDINITKPTVAIIFTDAEVDIPEISIKFSNVIWLIYNDPKIVNHITFGKKIFVNY